MALRSMTGFGQAEALSPDSTVYRIEIRSVNNRFLDIQLRLPKSLNALEQKVRQQVSSAIARGYITVNIACNGGATESRLTWDRESVESYMRIFREITSTYGLDGGITLSDLLRFSDFIKSESGTLSEEKTWAVLGPALATALADFVKSRDREGLHTEKELRKTLKSTAAALKKIEARAPVRLKNYAAELKQRVAKLVGEAGRVDESRLVTEVAMMADRLDISEECVRLRGHIEEFDKALSGDEPAGKRLGFLLQEMNREANTICSKANDALVAQLGISLKEQFERVREQLQNIE